MKRVKTKRNYQTMNYVILSVDNIKVTPNIRNNNNLPGVTDYITKTRIKDKGKRTIQDEQ